MAWWTRRRLSAHWIVGRLSPPLPRTNLAPCAVRLISAGGGTVACRPRRGRPRRGRRGRGWGYAGRLRRIAVGLLVAVLEQALVAERLPAPRTLTQSLPEPQPEVPHSQSLGAPATAGITGTCLTARCTTERGIRQAFLTRMVPIRLAAVSQASTAFSSAS